MAKTNLPNRGAGRQRMACGQSAQRVVPVHGRRHDSPTLFDAVSLKAKDLGVAPLSYPGIVTGCWKRSFGRQRSARLGTPRERIGPVMVPTTGNRNHALQAT